MYSAYCRCGLMDSQTCNFMAGIHLAYIKTDFNEDCNYIIITIVRSHTGKYHEFVAVCIVTSAQQCQRQQASDIYSSMASYYGDNDFIIRTFDFIACSDAVRVTCST